LLEEFHSFVDRVKNREWGKIRACVKRVCGKSRHAHFSFMQLRNNGRTHVRALVVVIPLQLLDEPVQRVLEIRIIFGHILDLLDSVDHG
jgi:hypothetical protein